MDDQRGAVLASWTFAEYEQHERSRRWYVLAALVAALFLVYAFVVRNFLFAVIVVMVAIIVYLRQSRNPETMACAITERGVALGDRMIPYEDLRNFWVVDDAGPSGTLYIHHRGVRPHLVIPIHDHDQLAIRAALRKFLPEDTDADEPASDAIARVLKL
ncbi:hypothetical protein HY480_02915 [Candidatus Uhrbacteria bacterium]|nr:hypothetical protein [Candidatus Uhrbacteria bacterium]